MKGVKDVVRTALDALKTWKFWKELIIMTLGMMVGAAAIYYFLVPSKLIIGTISGLSIVISTVLANIGITVKVSAVIVIINAILLILAYFLIGKEFGLKTVYTALILGPLMDLWDVICPYTRFLTEPGQTSVMGDIWFDLLCFVLLLSASQAILFRINASTGGLDILVICMSAFAINPFRMVVIGLIGTWINGLVIDYFTAALNKRKRVCVISKEPERIRDFIVHRLVRGCSLYEVKGGYTGERMQEVQALLTQNEFSSLMEFIKDNDIHAFITAGNVSEVYGRWLSHREQHERAEAEAEESGRA